MSLTITWWNYSVSSFCFGKESVPALSSTFLSGISSRIEPVECGTALDALRVSSLSSYHSDEFCSF